MTRRAGGPNGGLGDSSGVPRVTAFHDGPDLLTEAAATIPADDGDTVRVEYRHRDQWFLWLRESGRHSPGTRSGELTLTGTGSRGMSLTNIAAHRELELRFPRRVKKLSTGPVRRNRKVFQLSAGNIRMMSLSMVRRRLSVFADTVSVRIRMQSNSPPAN